MRSKAAQMILDRTSEATRIFVRKHADLVVRINQLLEEKGYTQKQLALKMDKQPSEINKWLKGEHNFTFKSICKLEAELGEDLIHIPIRYKPEVPVKMTVSVPSVPASKHREFIFWKKEEHKGEAIAC